MKAEFTVFTFFKRKIFMNRICLMCVHNIQTHTPINMAHAIIH